VNWATQIQPASPAPSDAGRAFRRVSTVNCTDSLTNTQVSAIARPYLHRE
jgi:hypothetical protein